MRTLALSIGNTSIFAAIFSGSRLTQSWRSGAAEMSGLFDHVPGSIDAAVFCSVVPALTPKLKRAIRRRWKIGAAQLDATAAHGLKIGYRHPAELGADRVAAAVGAHAKFPNANLVIVDFGTATTVTALHRDGTVLGGAIFPGAALWPEMLVARTAQLPRVSPRRPRRAVGRSTIDGIASGIFFGHVGAVRETVACIRTEAFGRAASLVIGTGGNAPAFQHEKLFHFFEPHLVLEGLRVFAARTVVV